MCVDCTFFSQKKVNSLFATEAMPECTREPNHGVHDDDELGSTLDEDLASFIFDLRSFDASMTSSSSTIEHDSPTLKTSNQLPVSSIDVQQRHDELLSSSSACRRYPFIKSKYDILNSPKQTTSSMKLTDPQTPCPRRYSRNENDQQELPPQRQASNLPNTTSREEEASDNNLIDTTIDNDSNIPDLTLVTSQDSVATVPSLTQRQCFYALDYGILVALCLVALWILVAGMSSVVWLPTTTTTAKVPTIDPDIEITITTASSITSMEKIDDNGVAPTRLADMNDNIIEPKGLMDFVDTVDGSRKKKRHFAQAPFLSKLDLTVAGISPLAVYM